jgi:predicted amidohydrolase
MTNTLTIAMAQINQRVGDLTGNADAMLAWRAKAVAADSNTNLILFPEQQLIGYPAEDFETRVSKSGGYGIGQDSCGNRRWRPGDVSRLNLCRRRTAL